MRIDQALYGEDRGGHALLGTSGGIEIANELAPRLDLPDTAPPGVEWSPFTSGFPFGQSYVVARTMVDTGSSRAGMVFSHALILPIDGAVNVDDLRPLFRCLREEPARTGTLSPLSLSADPSSPSPPAELSAVANMLVTRGSVPVVWLGIDGFESIIAAVWKHLWPAARRTFAFRLSFGPQDIVEQPPPAIVCTPSSLMARWSGHYAVRAGQVEAPRNRAAALLSGGKGGSPLQVFGQHVGAVLSSIADLALLEVAHTAADSEVARFDGVLTTLRIVEKLAPARSEHIGKVELLDKLVAMASSATADQILMMRNLSLAGFSTAEKAWRAVSNWLQANVFKQSEDYAFIQIFRDALTEENAVAPWRNAIWAGIDAAQAKRSHHFAGALWRWLDQDSAVAMDVIRKLRADPMFDPVLGSASPESVAQSAADQLMEISAGRRWLRVHASAASAAYPPLVAARRHIDIDKGADTSALQVALRRASQQEIVLIASQIDDDRLMKLGAEIVARQPSLISGADITNVRTQAILADALDSNPDAWRGFIDPKVSLWRILDVAADYQSRCPRLLAKLSKSQLADLSDYSQRSAVWPIVEGETKRNFLTATADGWLHQFRNTGFASSPEQELQTEILKEPRFDAFLKGCVPTQIGMACQLFLAIDCAPESRFVVWIRDLKRQFTNIGAADAEHIGRIVMAREWLNAANELVRQHSSYSFDLRPALRICVSLVPSWTRWLLNLSPVTSDEKWQILEDTAAELYSGGPDDQELWDRAGGKNSDLVTGETGRLRWQRALRDVRKGRGVRVENLLQQMRTDFPYNDQLRYLTDDREFGGGTENRS